MELYTKIPIQPSNCPIDYNSDVVLIGSCFAESMGEKFTYFKFQNLQNPFGILFHPKAIECFLSNVVNKKTYLKSDVFFHQDLWHCFEAHSRLSATTQDELLNKLNGQLALTLVRVQQATHVIITFGTAWIYQEKTSGKNVANCHKMPQRNFNKRLSTVAELEVSINSIVSLLKSCNADLNILFTISPVRHLKDGFVENTRSKSHLFSALHSVISGVSNCHYFPSYEIMMDELRDYRFYKRDLIHPNDMAIDYIWQQFKSTWISKDSYALMDRVELVQKGLNHKPFQPNSIAHLKFIAQLDKEQLSLKQLINHITF